MNNNRSMPKPQEAKAPEVVEKEESPVVEAAGGIEVIALRNGFFNTKRVKAGDRLIVPSFEQLGSWMECVDANAEKKHQSLMKIKKDKLKEKVGK